jgi:hypothetical protein
MQILLAPPRVPPTRCTAQSHAALSDFYTRVLLLALLDGNTMFSAFLSPESRLLAPMLLLVRAYQHVVERCRQRETLDVAASRRSELGADA